MLVIVLSIGSNIILKKAIGKTIPEVIKGKITTTTQISTTETTVITTTSTTRPHTTTTAPTTVTATATTTTTTTTTTEQSYYNGVPAEIYNKYSSKLVYEGRRYVVTLDGPKDNIRFRSSPSMEKDNSNFICNILNGTVVDVVYIYDGVWALFEYNGKWGFASIYSNADSSRNNIMNVY